MRRHTVTIREEYDEDDAPSDVTFIVGNGMGRAVGWAAWCLDPDTGQEGWFGKFMGSEVQASNLYKLRERCQQMLDVLTAILLD
jgi:hypothetical protein